MASHLCELNVACYVKPEDNWACCSRRIPCFWGPLSLLKAGSRRFPVSFIFAALQGKKGQGKPDDRKFLLHKDHRISEWWLLEGTSQDQLVNSPFRVGSFGINPTGTPPGRLGMPPEKNSRALWAASPSALPPSKWNFFFLCLHRTSCIPVCTCFLLSCPSPAVRRVWLHPPDICPLCIDQHWWDPPYSGSSFLG